MEGRQTFEAWDQFRPVETSLTEALALRLNIREPILVGAVEGRE